MECRAEVLGCQGSTRHSERGDTTRRLKVAGRYRALLIEEPFHRHALAVVWLLPLRTAMVPRPLNIHSPVTGILLPFPHATRNERNPSTRQTRIRTVCKKKKGVKCTLPAVICLARPQYTSHTYHRIPSLPEHICTVWQQGCAHNGSTACITVFSHISNSSASTMLVL